MARHQAPQNGNTAGAARRRQILDAALVRFGRDGYRQTPLALIARDAGITDAGLLHHFGDKRQLLLAVMEYWRTRPEKRGTPETVRDTFRCHIEDVTEALTVPGMVELAVVVGTEAVLPGHPAHDFFPQWQENGVRALADRLRTGSATGEIKADLDHQGIARELAALECGLQVQWLAGGRSFDLVAAMRSHLDRLLRSISCDGQGL